MLLDSYTTRTRNFGDVSATANGVYTAGAYGLVSFGDFYSTVGSYNGSSITAEASATYQAVAAGLVSNADGFSSVYNDGSISAVATADDSVGAATAYGVYTGAFYSNFLSGSESDISAEASGYVAEAFGVAVNGYVSDFYNEGGISASAEGYYSAAVGALVRTHLDMLPTALTMAGLALLLRRRPVLAFTLLGLGTATKLVPGLVAVVALAWLLGRGDRRAAWQGALALAAVVILVLLPFSSDGMRDAVRFHMDRPVQIESTPATILWAEGRSYVTGTSAHPDQYKSNGLAGGGAAAVETVFSILLLAMLIGILVLAAVSHEERDLVLCAFAALLAYVTLGKVFSPQYLVWLYPFAAIAWSWPRPVRAPARIAADLVIAAAVLGLLYFPGRYFDLVSGDTSVEVLVGLRNGLLIAALVLVIATVAGRARSTPPTAAPAPG